MKKEMKDAVLDAGNYRTKSDTLEKDLNKERSDAEKLTKKFVALDDAMTKKGTELRKLEDQHVKAQAKVDKMTEKLKKYETKMDSMVTERVGETIMEKDEAVRKYTELKENSDESGALIEKLKKQMEKKKDELLAEKEKLDTMKEEH